jgi:imidazolonepropionase
LCLLEELDEHPLAVTPSYRCPAGAKLLSTIHRRGIARLIEVEVGQSGARSMLAAARHLGFYVRLVTAGTVSVEAAMLAIEFDACALGGFSSIDPRALALLAESNVVATLLPGRDFAQGAGHYPPARDMIARNVPVAIATGFDSCAPSTCSMPAVIAIACSQMRLTPAEAITAATWNASCALALQHRTGSLTAGKQADLLVLHCSDYRDLATRFGINPVSMVVRRGELIYPRMGGR